jgi:hypothetical protein
MLSPTINPPKKPVFELDLGVNFENLVKSCSVRLWNFGINKLTPKNKIIIIENKRRESAGIPIILTIEVKKSVKKVKLKIKPVTTPKGLFFPPTIELDKTIGNIGRIHGDRIVTIPPRNEKLKRSNIND